MSENKMERKDLIDPEMKNRLQMEIQATDEELIYLEKLLKIQQEKMNKERGSRRQPSVVIDNFLYHGDLGHAIDLDLLLELHIQHIINICDCPLDEEIKEIFRVLWIEDVEDNFYGDIRSYFDKTNQFLSECKEKNEKVLVHCQAGISRSSSIILAYLIRVHHDNLDKAYEYLLDRRPIAAPNYGFLIKLIRYEKEIRANEQHKVTDDQQNPIKPLENSTSHKSQF